jgi:hypothetical protein
MNYLTTHFWKLNRHDFSGRDRSLKALLAWKVLMKKRLYL